MQVQDSVAVDTTTRVARKYVRNTKSLSFRIGDMGDPYALIIMEYSTELNDHVVRIGWSRCSKSDNFTKARASEIAEGRLYTAPIEFSVYDKCLQESQIDILIDKGFNKQMIHTLENMVYLMYLNKYYPKPNVGIGNSWGN